MPRTALIYGESGATKTTQLYFIAKWLKEKWEKEGKKLKIRYITCDGGGYAPFEDSGMVEEGFVEVCDITASNRAYAEINMLSEGYWPKGGRYLKDNTEWLMPNVNGIGAYFVESLDGIGETWNRHMSHDKSGRAGFKHSFTYEEEIGGNIYTVGGLDKGHFGIMQTEIMSIVKKGFNQLDVERVFYSAKVSKGTDEISKEPRFGPATIGVAQTGKVPGWVQDCIHLEDKKITLNNGNEVLAKVAWLRNHPESNTEIIFLAKVRLMPERVPEMLKEFKGGYFVLGFKVGNGLDKFYRWRGE